MQTEMQTWVTETHQRLKAQAPGWHIWHVYMPLNPAGVYSWSACPEGAKVAVCTAHDPDILLDQIEEYTAALRDHVQDTRAKLERCPPGEQTRTAMLQALLSALLKMESGPRAEMTR